MQKEGLSPQEVTEYLSAKENKEHSVTQRIKNLSEDILQKVTTAIVRYATPNKISPGMYAYADGLISFELIPDRRVKAIIGYVEGKTAYAICLRQKMLPWGPRALKVYETRKMTSGEEATQKILEIARQEEYKAPAAQWCFDYARDGVNQGEAFLPSMVEQEKLGAHHTAVNISLGMLGVALLDTWYLSSNEYCNDGYACLYNIYNGNKSMDDKCSPATSVRPMIAIEI